VDESGVALAAIQGLNQKLEEQRAENAELKRRLEALEKYIRGEGVAPKNSESRTENQRLNHGWNTDAGRGQFIRKP